MAKYKIIVPKAGAANEQGTEVKLYEAESIIDASENWQDSLMQAFVANGWAMEVKVDSPEEKGEPVRAKNDDGTFKADDPTTPDVNEAWEGGEAPKKKTAKKTTKKTTAKKTTKKKA